MQLCLLRITEDLPFGGDAELPDAWLVLDSCCRGQISRYIWKRRHREAFMADSPWILVGLSQESLNDSTGGVLFAVWTSSAPVEPESLSPWKSLNQVVCDKDSLSEEDCAILKNYFSEQQIKHESVYLLKSVGQF